MVVDHGLRDAIALLSKKIASTVGIIKVLDLKNDSDKIQETLDEYSILSDITKQNFEIVCKIIQHAKKMIKLNQL